MKILIVYFNWEFSPRSTLFESVLCFSQYSNSQVFYVNVYYGVPDCLEQASFDLVIYHYSLLTYKSVHNGEVLFSKEIMKLISIKGVKIAIPQDEYICSEILCKFLKEHRVIAVFSCFQPNDYRKLYPFEESGVSYIFTCLPGYVDENQISKVISYVDKNIGRPIDLGYRARKNSFWIGKLGMLKWEITEAFLLYKDSIVMDISNDPSDTFFGDEWLKFLARCRCQLGVSSAVSILDKDGSIRQCVDSYTKNNPDVTYDVVENVCFPGQDGYILQGTVSPRHFEACMTKTCQVLVEGNYAGVFKPGVHYIEVKKDWSNVREVIEKIKDPTYCEKIADRAYQDIILSGNYTYRKFVQEVLDFAQTQISEPAPENAKMFRLLEWREKYPYLFHPFLYAYTGIKSYAKLYLLRKGWLKFFIK